MNKYEEVEWNENWKRFKKRLFISYSFLDAAVNYSISASIVYS
jgi:hypothetical protein